MACKYVGKKQHVRGTPWPATQLAVLLLQWEVDKARPSFDLTDFLTSSSAVKGAR
jgi:hypothetical protein